MVFSFFKKQPEKMISRPAVVPRQADVREKSSSGGKGEGVPQEPVAKDVTQTTEAVVQESAPSDFSDFVFSQSSLDFQVEIDVDPVDALAEEAAVLFANNQDDAAQTVLENGVQTHRSPHDERLWLMLFDLYRVSAKQPAFEALGIEYARAFEKSPPGWGSNARDKVKAPENAGGNLLFKGDLLGSNTPAFDAVKQALEKNPKLRLDMSKVKQFDPQGCGSLLKLLVQARKNRRAIELLGREALGALVQGSVETGRAEDKECWLLLLELCQLQGQQEAFEEVAIDYAVTFEESPPSWEPGRIAAPEPPDQAVAVVAGDAGGDEYFLSSEVKSSRFADLPAFAEIHDPVLIDCSDMTRMDFVSAGALLNVLTTVRNSGKQIVFRHPNHLVAELFGVVGLKAVAAIVFPKH